MNGTSKIAMLDPSEQIESHNPMNPSTIGYRNTPLHPKLSVDTDVNPSFRKHNIPSPLLDKGGQSKVHQLQSSFPKKSDVRSFWQAKETSSSDETLYFTTGSSSPIKKSTPLELLAGKSPVRTSIFASQDINGPNSPIKRASSKSSAVSSSPFLQQHRRQQSVTRIPIPVPQPKNTSPRTSLTPERKFGLGDTSTADNPLPERTFSPKSSLISNLQSPSSPGADSDGSQATPRRKRKTVKFDDAAPQILHFERESTQSPYSASSFDFAGMYGSEDESEGNSSIRESPGLVEDWAYSNPAGAKHGGLPDPFQLPSPTSSRGGRPLPQVPGSASPSSARTLPTLPALVSSPTSKEALVEKLRELRRKASEMDVAAKKKSKSPESSSAPEPVVKVPEPMPDPDSQAKPDLKEIEKPRSSSYDDLGISINGDTTYTGEGFSPVALETEKLPIFPTASSSESDTYFYKLARSSTHKDLAQEVKEESQIDQNTSPSFKNDLTSTSGLGEVYEIKEELSEDTYTSSPPTVDNASIDTVSPNVALITSFPPTPDLAENLNDETEDDSIADASRPHMPEYIATVSPLMLPEFGALGDIDLGLSGYMSSPTTISKNSDAQTTHPKLVQTNLASSEHKSLAHAVFRPSTPESQMKTDFNDGENEDTLNKCSPEVSPERATVKGRGLKIRPSLTPADAATIAAKRRKVSGESHIENKDEVNIEAPTTIGFGDDSKPDSAANEEDEKPMMVMTKTIELPRLEIKLPRPSDTGFSDIGQAFERVIEGQKRGYLMRQNTNIVHASSDKDLSHYRHDSANVESVSSSPDKNLSPRVTELDVPPAPSKNKSLADKSNQKRSSTSKKTQIRELGEIAIKKVNEKFADCGRLFVRVLRVKDLDLKLPLGTSFFILDMLTEKIEICISAVHWTTVFIAFKQPTTNSNISRRYVKNSSCKLALDDLEFMLTLQVKVEKQPVLPISPSKSKQSAFSRVFSSPKKTKKLQEQEAAAIQHQQPLHGIVGNDGSFARVYVSLDTYKDSAFGRPYSTEVTLMNEWATDVEIQYGCKPKLPLKITRRRPYKIGKLDLQMLYMPPAPRKTPPPRSLAACIKEMQTTEWYSQLLCEGHLSQQGGDCSTWRRRYFKLVGPKLYAFHEASRTLRAAISLTKATGLYDDKNRLAQAEGSRRTSAFAEQEEGYMYVEEGFRIRFFDGEVIDFYAESEADKERWMKALGQIICYGKIPEKAAWAEIVLQREARLLNNSRCPRLTKRDR
ncbi:hypothetical protein NEOLI_003543 [Neolecta irregularis DAH-3]|uniref:PH domain-containing protein n=1 Tax=Neolecta irregularis (strain DAH-3) TaxID=1198029 RepID=A0A1U7LP48_NEOID|nr:hypothetical protein NEOLI_003543 [Neolecta irregularis DAH-3]|eukprot:OLL24427.1 hypothetical protein NEOLI_003543 [Neolecta irregularis DAH-3]